MTVDSASFIDITSFILGMMAGGLIVACIAIPRVGRVLTKCLATVLLAAGVGLLVWVTVQETRGGTLTPIIWQQVSISEPGEAFGWGGGLVFGGLLALVLSSRLSSDHR